MNGHLQIITPPETEPVTAEDIKMYTHIDNSAEDPLLQSWIQSARTIAESYLRRALITQTLELTLDYFPGYCSLPANSSYPGYNPYPGYNSAPAYNSNPAYSSLPVFNTVGEIFLPRPPLQYVASFKYYDYADAENSFALTNFIIDETANPGRMRLAYGVAWPSVTLRSINAIKIRYIAGYGSEASDVPGNIRDAIMLYCAYRNENRSGEIEKVPKQFYDLLAPDRMFL
jgi:hypothetical protein